MGKPSFFVCVFHMLYERGVWGNEVSPQRGAGIVSP